MLSPRDVNVGFESWPAVDELFPARFQGVNPNRGLEGSLVDTDKGSLSERMQDYFGELDSNTIATRHPVLMTKRARYRPAVVRNELRRRSQFLEERVTPYLVFPLDLRWIYYESEAKLLNERRPEFWENLRANEFLVTVPQPRRVSESLPLISKILVDLHVHDRGSVCFPTWTKGPGGLYGAEAPNIDSNALARLKAAWPDAVADDDDGRVFVARLFRATVALMHAPQYQADHAGALSQDWAHLPFPHDSALFDRLVAAGEKVVTLLDPEADPAAVVEQIVGADVARVLGVVRSVGGIAVPATDFVVTVSYFGAARGRWQTRAYSASEVAPPELGDMTGDLYLNDQVFIANVPVAVWQFELGGYPVIKKWLGYRHVKRLGEKPISLAELRHLRRMVQRIAALVAFGPLLNRLYDGASADAFTAEELGLR